MQVDEGSLKHPQTFSDLFRPPQTFSDLLRPLQTSSDLFRPFQTSSDPFRPPQTSSDFLRPLQTSSALLGLPQTFSDLLGPAQTTSKTAAKASQQATEKQRTEAHQFNMQKEGGGRVEKWVVVLRGMVFPLFLTHFSLLQDLVRHFATWHHASRHQQMISSLLSGALLSRQGAHHVTSFVLLPLLVQQQTFLWV